MFWEDISDLLKQLPQFSDDCAKNIAKILFHVCGLVFITFVMVPKVVIMASSFIALSHYLALEEEYTVNVNFYTSCTDDCF